MKKNNPMVYVAYNNKSIVRYDADPKVLISTMLNDIRKSLPEGVSRFRVIVNGVRSPWMR